MEILLRLRRAARERAARHAERIPHLDRLGLPHDGDPHQLTPWEEIFARPEWQETKQEHHGQCTCCGASVEADQSSCGVCGAVWREPAKRSVMPYVVFWSAAILASIALSLTVARVLGLIAYHWLSTHHPGKPIDSDLLGFGQTYLMVSGALVILLLFTFVLERLDFGAKGHWECGREGQTAAKLDQ